MTVLARITTFFEPTSAWFKKHSPYSFGITLCALVPIVLCLWLLAPERQANKQIAAIESLYVQQLTQLIAVTLSPAAAAKDLISMQAELNELVQQDHIAFAAIYDINNRVKVQAGINTQQALGDEYFLSHSAPITQDENIIGRITITTQRLSSTTVIHFFIAALFSLSFILLFLLFRKTVSALPIDDTQAVAAKEEFTHTQVDISESHTITLLIQLKNSERIFEQLTREIREETLDTIQLSIQKALKLYGGEISAIDSQSIIINVNSHEKEDAIFNALCCGALIQKIALDTQWLIKTNAVIYSIADANKPLQLTKALQNIKKQANNSVFIHKALTTIPIAEGRIQIKTQEKNNVHFCELSEFSEKYQKLLAKQCNHLTPSSKA